MKELNIFIDESGDFGEVVNTSPYYIVTLVFHNNEIDISENISRLELQLSEAGFKDEYIHTHPLIRREFPYEDMTIDERRKILNKMLRFAIGCDIKFHSIIINRRDAADKMRLSAKIANSLSKFLKENSNYFYSFEKITVYYDNGQQELSIIINTILNSFFTNVDFVNASPKKYKLLQAADFFCSMQLLSLKKQDGTLTKSEQNFFYKPQELQKNYLKSVKKKEFR